MHFRALHGFGFFFSSCSPSFGRPKGNGKRLTSSHSPCFPPISVSATPSHSCPQARCTSHSRGTLPHWDECGKGPGCCAPPSMGSGALAPSLWPVILSRSMCMTSPSDSTSNSQTATPAGCPQASPALSQLYILACAAPSMCDALLESGMGAWLPAPAGHPSGTWTYPTHALVAPAVFVAGGHTRKHFLVSCFSWKLCHQIIAHRKQLRRKLTCKINRRKGRKRKCNLPQSCSRQFFGVISYYFKFYEESTILWIFVSCYFIFAAIQCVKVATGTLSGKELMVLPSTKCMELE